MLASFGIVVEAGQGMMGLFGGGGGGSGALEALLAAGLITLFLREHHHGHHKYKRSVPLPYAHGY